jgi:hypothetical protein
VGIGDRLAHNGAIERREFAMASGEMTEDEFIRFLCRKSEEKIGIIRQFQHEQIFRGESIEFA